MTDSVFIELRASGHWDLHTLTAEWSEEDKARLNAGDPAAFHELHEQVTQLVLSNPHTLQTLQFDVGPIPSPAMAPLVKEPHG